MTNLMTAFGRGGASWGFYDALLGAETLCYLRRGAFGDRLKIPLLADTLSI